jgi:hypothetical protein
MYALATMITTWLLRGLAILLLLLPSLVEGTDEFIEKSVAISSTKKINDRTTLGLEHRTSLDSKSRRRRKANPRAQANVPLQIGLAVVQIGSTS